MTNPPTPPSGSEPPERPAPVEHAHALPAGTVIEGYRIERLLGEGGFGLTYYAIEEAIDRPVAIKEYLPIGIGARDHQSLAVMPVSEERGADFEWGLERFRKEAATLVQFEHPNIVSIHRYFEALGTAYLVMPFIEGVSLEDIIKRLGHVPEAELRVIVDPLLDGLEEIHKADYLHRDIKPANIVMRPDGTPVLIDFGAARRFRNSNTVPLTSILTEGFAPLEQYQPDSEQGPWTDIYALGAVLYMCVSGERPMSATTRVEALAMDKPDPMDSAAASCVGTYSPALLAAIDAALHLSREERPQTVAAFRAMLDGANPPAQAAPAPAALPVGPDGAPLPPPQVSPAAQARPGRTIRISDEDRVFPSAEPAQGNVDTLALETSEERRARRLRSSWTLALSALLVAALVGGGFAAWRISDAGAPDPVAAADTGSDASADTTAATALEKAVRSLATAKRALQGGDFDQATAATAAALRQARASLEAKPGSQRAKILIAEIAGFQQALAGARKQHVATLLNNAAKAIQSKQWAEAETLIADAERAGAGAAEVARLRARLTEARNAGGRIKEPPKDTPPPVAELAAADRLIGQGWQALRKGDLPGAVGHARNAGQQIAAARTGDAAKPRIASVAAKAGELRQAIALGLNKRITKLRREADSAMQSGDVDGGKRRLETADRLRRMLAALNSGSARRAPTAN